MFAKLNNKKTIEHIVNTVLILNVILLISIIIVVRQTSIFKRHVKRLYYSKRNAVKQISRQILHFANSPKLKKWDNSVPLPYKLKRPSILCDSYWYRFESINLKSHFNRPQNKLVAIILFRVMSFHFFSMSIMKSGAENPTDSLFNLRTGIYTKDISKPPQRPSFNICSLILQTDVSSIIIPSWCSVLLQHSILPLHIKIIWLKFLPCSLIQTRYSIW